jgi:hypothetical protein
VAAVTTPRADDDAKNVGLFAPDNPASPLAFDHAEILATAFYRGLSEFVRRVWQEAAPVPFFLDNRGMLDSVLRPGRAEITRLAI